MIIQIALMLDKTTGGENNRANNGNQSSRHHHTRGAGSSFPSSEEIESQQQDATQPHEYYPDFDQTGKGVNPAARVTRESNS